MTPEECLAEITARARTNGTLIESRAEATPTEQEWFYDNDSDCDECSGYYCRCEEEDEKERAGAALRADERAKARAAMPPPPSTDELIKSNLHYQQMLNLGVSKKRAKMIRRLQKELPAKTPKINAANAILKMRQPE